MDLHSLNLLPPTFLSHGSPMTALDGREAGAFWATLGATLGDGLLREGPMPRRVLAVSAHSLTREPVLLGAAHHEAVYDFGGFDPQLHTLRYDAPGAPALAERVQALLRDAGLPVHRVDEGGLDHGIWVPLRFALPAADVPVLPLAWPPDWSPARLFALGEALAPLAGEDVWIVGSGSITHNLPRVFGSGLRPPVDQPATPESTAFRDWWAARSAEADWPALFDYRRQAPFAELMHPSDEHLLPWFVAAGAGGRLHGAVRVHQSLTYGDLGMDAYAFGAAAERLGALLTKA